MDLLKQGQKISLYIQKDDTLVEIIGTITEIYDDRLDIELPPYFMRYIEFLDVGKFLTAKVFSKVGTIDFNSIVISSPIEDESFAIEFDANALRLTVSSEIPVIASMEKLRLYDKDWSYIAKTFEISTEYVKFYSDKDFNVDDTFNCELILPDEYGIIKFRATVTEKDPLYDREYTAAYYNMSEKDRQTLLYYIYIYTNNSEQETT